MAINSLVFNSFNNWWSYRLSFEAFFREIESGQDSIWINVAHKNKYKFEGYTSDYLFPLLYRNQNNSLLKFKKNNNLNIEVSFLEIKDKFKKIYFKNHEELKTYTIEGLPLGMLVYVQMCGRTESINFAMNRKNNKLINYFLNLGYETYRKVQEKIREYSPEKILVVNDRHLPSAAAIFAAKSMNVKHVVFYWGSSENKFSFFENSLFDTKSWHDSILKNSQILQNNSHHSDKIKTQFIEEHSIISQDSKTFRKYVEEGKRLDLKASKLAVMYTGTEWEDSAVNLKIYKSTEYQDQYDAFYQVAKYLSKLNWQVVLKLHPKRKKLFNNQEKSNLWEKFSNIPNITVLEKKTNIDTYELIKQADLNIVWTSHVGLECIARTAPIMIVGDPYWCFSYVNNLVRTNEKLKIFINEQNYIFPVDEVLPYFSYMKSFGEDFIYVNNKNYVPSYNGTNIIERRLFTRILAYFYVSIKKYRNN